MATVSVSAAQDSGTDTGLVLDACQSLAVVASGRWTWATDGNRTAAADGDPTTIYSSPIPGITVFGLYLFLYPDGLTPPSLPTVGVFAAGQNNEHDVCSATYSALEVLASYSGAFPARVWARIADTVLTDNAGSISLTVTSAADGSVPEAPEGVAAAFSLDPVACVVSVTVSWDAIVGAVSYSVYRDGALAAALVSGTSWTDTTAQVGTSYSYTVRALSACGTSDDSLPVSVTPETGLSAPAVTACQCCCRKRVRVTWSAVTTVEGVVTGYGLLKNGMLYRQLPASVLCFTDCAVDARPDVTYSVLAELGCWDGPAGEASIRVRGFQGDTLPSTSFGGGSAPTTSYTDQETPGTDWAGARCDCGTMDSD